MVVSTTRMKTVFIFAYYGLIQCYARFGEISFPGREPAF
jgi:hypothetical protein